MPLRFRLNLVRCPNCGKMREVRGSLYKAYVLAADGIRELNCYACSRPWAIVKLRDRAWLADAYASQSQIEIARGLDCHPTTVRNALIGFGIPLRTRSEARRAYETTRGQARTAGKRNRQMVEGRGQRGPGRVRFIPGAAGRGTIK